MINLDVEPQGHISEGIDLLSREIDEVKEELGQTNRRLDTMSHQMNTLLARQEVMLEMMTRISVKIEYRSRPNGCFVTFLLPFVIMFIFFGILL